MCEDNKVDNHYLLTNERLNEIKNKLSNVQNLSPVEYNINNQHLKISMNTHFTSIDNIYNINGKFIPGLVRYNYVYGVYHIDNDKIIYIVYRIENNKFDVYEDKIPLYQ